MKVKRKSRKILFCFIFIVMFMIGRNKYYEYKFNQSDEEIIKRVESLKMDSISYLNSLKDNDQKIKTIMDRKNEYPSILLEMLARNLDMTDYVFNYLELKGKTFSLDIGKVQKGEYPLLLQYDKRWGYGYYGEDVIAINGCGPTSLAVVIAGLTGRSDITPFSVATYAYQNGYYDNGTSWYLFTEGVKNYGIIGTELPLSKTLMMSELEKGHPIICSMGRGDFTTTGHIIVITGIKNGQFIINDPNSRERSNRLWSYDRIKNQIKNMWSFTLDS